MKKKSYESYTLTGECGKIMIYRDENDDCHLICDLKPHNPKPSQSLFRFDGTYTDKDTDLSYRLNVSVKVTGKHKCNYSKKFADGVYGTLRTETRKVPETPMFNMVKFSGDRYGVMVNVMIPQIALTHKFTTMQKSKGPRRLGPMTIHDKHGVQEITSVVNGGRFSPK